MDQPPGPADRGNGLNFSTVGPIIANRDAMLDGVPISCSSGGGGGGNRSLAS